MKQEISNEVVKATPPLAVVGASFAGLSLNDWLIIASIGYVALQAAYLVWQWRQKAKQADGTAQ